jgi:hypothetical protein
MAQKMTVSECIIIYTTCFEIHLSVVIRLLLMLFVKEQLMNHWWSFNIR